MAEIIRTLLPPGTLNVTITAGGVLVDGADLTQDNLTLANGLATGSGDLGFDGTNWDRIRTNAAAILAGTTQPFAKLVAHPGEWPVFHAPAANTKATASKAAGAAGVRHVCKSISASLNALTTAVESVVALNLIDGVSGGTVIWSLILHAIPAGTTGISIAGLNIVGSAATAMTLEFAAAGGADTTESVAMTGYSTI